MLRRLLALTMLAAWSGGLCLAAQGASAAPTTRAKTQLVPFATAPFPFDGRPLPGQDEPFFDVEKDGRRGHTSVRGGGIYWEDATYSDRRVLLHIPAGFDPARPGLMIVYLHGNQATLERDVRNRQQVPRQVAQSGLNAVLVAPQLAVDALDSIGGRFHEPGHFRRFVEEACVQLARLHGNRRAARAFDALAVVIVAYSGGYYPTAWILRDGGLGDRLRGVILLDGLYSDLDKFANWIASHEGAFFLSAHSLSSREENTALQRLLTERGINFSTTLPARLLPGSVAFVATGDEVVHRDFVTSAWGGDPLRAVLGRIVGYPRTHASARARKR
jgi:hypothetical protein